VIKYSCFRIFVTKLQNFNTKKAFNCHCKQKNKTHFFIYAHMSGISVLISFNMKYSSSWFHLPFSCLSTCSLNSWWHLQYINVARGVLFWVFECILILDWKKIVWSLNFISKQLYFESVVFQLNSLNTISRISISIGTHKPHTIKKNLHSLSTFFQFKSHFKFHFYITQSLMI